MTERKIAAMHRRYGRDDKHLCKDCNHLICREYGRRYYKCEMYGLSKSDATDWRVSYQACGMYNQPAVNAYMTMVNLELKKYDEPLDGQIGMEVDGG